MHDILAFFTVNLFQNMGVHDAYPPADNLTKLSKLQ
jgi:hypothetical protein